MNTQQNNQTQHPNEAANSSTQPQAADVSRCASVSCAKRNNGGTGAPPSNRAPDKCIDTFFQPLRWGIDTLELSYPGNLLKTVDEDLRDLKTLAQGRDDLAAMAQYPLGSHRFEVKDKGARRFPFILQDDAFYIRLSSHKAKKLPLAHVQISSGYLSHETPLKAERYLRDLLAPLGDELSTPTVSRVDMYVDFASTHDMESLGRHAWVTRASQISQHAQNGKFTGWSIGAGGILLCRLYDKIKEIQKSGKLYLENLWRQAGWDGETPVWRLEFEFRRGVLAQLDQNSLYRVMENRNGLWSYATTEWLKLTIPNDTDKTRSRWEIHPLWSYLSSIDWETEGGPLLRKYSPNRSPSKKWVGQRALGTMASIAAIEGVNDFDQALDLIGNTAFQQLADQAAFIGIPESQHFAEKVAVLNRKYNTTVNLRENETASDALSKEYRRMSSGY